MNFDPKEIQSALQQYALATGKDEVDILKRAGRNVAVKAFAKTETAEAAKVRSYLSADNYRMAGIILAKRGKLRGLTRKQQAVVVRRFIAASVRSVRYIKVGWARAGQAFGAFQNVKVNPKSEAAKGFGEMPTTRNLVAVIANNARGADSVAAPALEEAMAATARDMGAYAARKMAATAAKYSAR